MHLMPLTMHGDTEPHAPHMPLTIVMYTAAELTGALLLSKICAMRVEALMARSVPSDTFAARVERA